MPQKIFCGVWPKIIESSWIAKEKSKVAVLGCIAIRIVFPFR